MERVKYENGDFNNQENPLPLFPPSTQQCYNGFSTRNKCVTGIEPMTKYGNILGEDITNPNFKQIMKDYSFSPLRWDIWKDIEEDGLTNLRNPGVPVFIMYSNTMDTAYSYNYNFNPKDFTS